MNLRRDVFQAISDPSRRAILLLLAGQSLNAGQIAAQFESARPTISKHISLLAECGLVIPEPQGRQISYRINPDKVKEIDDFLAPFRSLWEDRFTKLENYMKENPA